MSAALTGATGFREWEMNETSANSRCLVFALFLCSVSISFAQEQRGEKPTSLVGMISLIVREPVLRELQIEQDSLELLKIRLLLKSFPGVLQERINHPLQSDQDAKLTPQEIYAKVEAGFVDELRELLKPAQFARLQQIHWQRWGVQALHDAELAQALEITTEQAEKLKAVKTDFESRQQELQSQRDELRTTGADVREVERALKAIERDRARAYDDVLTSEQRIRFAELKGRPFELPPSENTTRKGSVLSSQPRSGGLIYLANKVPVTIELGIENQFALLAEISELATAYSSELNQQRQASKLSARRNLRELESTLQEKYTVALRKLLTADQFQRLKQIQWQQLGNEALNELEVVSELEITVDQQRQIAALNQELVKKVRLLINVPGGRAGGSAVGDQLQKQMLAVKRELDDQVLQVLTAEQRAKFDRLKGKPFDLDLLKSRLVKDSDETPPKK